MAMLGEQPTVALIAALALILIGVAVGISGGVGAPRRWWRASPSFRARRTAAAPAVPRFDKLTAGLAVPRREYHHRP